MLKEQIISARGGGGGRGGAGRGGGDDRVLVVTTEGRAGKITQRPSARRDAGKARGAGASAQRAKSKRGSWQRALAWAPAVAKVLVAVCAGLVLFRGYRAAASSTFFDVRSVDVSGVSQASEDQIKQIVRRGAAAGVWKADLEALSAEIAHQPWVRTAVVTRVLPSGLRVRISERVPRVVLHTAAGRFVWVDDDGVAVGPLTPAQQQPTFFMRGFDESDTEAAHAGNRERVKTFMTLAGEWESAGLAARVSELNLDDLRDVRAQLAGDDSQIEVRLGKEDWTKRLGQALGKLDEQRQTPRGALITYIDMTQGKRAVFGFNPHAQPPAGGAAIVNADEAAGESTVNARTVKASMTADDVAKTNAAAPRRPADDAKGAARAKTEARAPKSGAKRSEKAEKSRGGAQSAVQSRTGSERPRRVTKSG
ncbi:MAG TPA: FtsQ-type POTRA domain-containing protein [Pyrinomonadaceae bacterium]|jgi:cell division septal protein FtsQ|nr:FtsQ-type POTRA domain-containing protein [Pyrinomonadaceae bacterium]